MRRAGILLAAAAAAAAAGACGKKRQARTGDAAPVELVTTVALGDRGDGGTGQPSESDEREPNDTDDVATALAPGALVRGRIEPDSDVDHYRIDVEQAGALSVRVGPVAGTDLTLEIEDDGGAVIARSDRGAANVAEGVPNLGVTPGRYTAVVRKKVPPPKKPPRGRRGAPPPPPAPGSAPVYEIAAQVAPFGKNAEREPNDDRATANDLIIGGDPVTGYIGWTGDADVWKFSVEAMAARNVLELELGPIENVAFSVEIADGIGRPILARKAPRGVALAIRGLAPAVSAGAPPYHYVTIKADRSNPEVAYQLRLGAGSLEADPEIEPNDTPDKAMAIPADRVVVRAASWTPGDVDCYAIPPDPADRTIDITVDTPAEADLRLELFVDGKPAGTANQKGKGVQEKISGAVPPGGRAVVCVKGTDASREGRYDLGFQEGPPKAP